MSRSSLLTTFVLSHKGAQSESNCLTDRTIPVVINQGKTALKLDFGESLRRVHTFEAIPALSVASKARVISSWLCATATSKYLRNSRAFWRFPRVHALRCREG